MPPKAKKSTAKRARSPETQTDADAGGAKKCVKKTKTEAEKEPAEDKPLTGKFDIYPMELSFLKSVYLPSGESNPQFAALYKTILKYQAKPDSTGRCLLPETGAKPGRLRTPLRDPMEEMPWDISIEDIELVDKLVFTAAQRKDFITPPTTGAGVSGRTALTEDHCGVSSASGVFRMKLAWTGEDGAEIFEGFLSFNVKYSGLYKRKGHGSGGKLEFPFWAVRARKGDDGKEISLSRQTVAP
ncbi:hypothetical protein FB45DRAFT_1103402 [Roridomyces roridus]|uniref:Uncharacterized protein n=1 Tax=Roridomyces roridus TaxID=1738132 RepID=A0AAD7FDT0_9AGAR|nr:hypothetical protein FB45DRAFT_1103402 [Roridomyces roridus]